MKKVKRIMALAGIILLLALYVIAFVLAFTAHDEQSFRAFIVAIIATVVVPLIIIGIGIAVWLRRRHL